MERDEADHRRRTQRTPPAIFAGPCAMAHTGGELLHRSGTYPPATPTGEYTVWCSCISRARNAPAHDSM